MTSVPTDPADWDVDAARADLAGKLDEVRAAPGAPLGDDADVLAMSLPPYATACPNPYLGDWLAATEPEGHADRAYIDPGPFTTDISEGKSNPFYKAHSYPTKVPHPAIMRFILHYTEPGDVVLDGFCGTGMTGVAAQACGAPDGDTKRKIEDEFKDRPPKWGPRRAILSDLSPSATFIAAGLNLPVDARAFDIRSAEILDEFDAEWGWMYETTDDRGHKRPFDYVVWSEVFTCPNCAGPVVFYDVAYNERTGRVRDDFDCPNCGKALTKRTLQPRKVHAMTPAGDSVERLERQPAVIHYRVGSTKKSKAVDSYDRSVLRRIDGLGLPGRVPTGALPFMHMTHERAPMPSKGFTHAHHFWGDRALVAVAALWRLCSEEPDPQLRAALLFWVEQALWGLSWMNRFQPIQQGKLGGSQVNRQMTGVYYVSSLASECRPRYNLEGSQATRGKRRSLLKAWESSPARLGRVITSTGSSEAIDLPNGSVDYIFVDPPFGSNIYYADLAYLVESWHQVWTDAGEEAIVNESRRVPRTLPEYGERMGRCFEEFFRVLKPGRWMTVEFSNSSNEVWLTIQNALAKAGFVVADTRIIDKEQLSAQLSKPWV